MSNRERAIRYMEGEMTPGEKREFEAELLSSKELRNEIELYRKLISRIDEIKNIPAGQNYKATVIPRFRINQQGIRKNIYPAYAVIAVTVALFLLFLNLPQNPVEKTINNNLSVQETDSVMNDLAELELNIDSVVSNNEEYSAAVDEMLYRELNISESELDSIYYSAYYNSSQNFTEISDEESQVIYDEIINKRFF